MIDERPEVCAAGDAACAQQSWGEDIVMLAARPAADYLSYARLL